eukprot:TRINITY_DN3671_c0_g1_i10.p2 TRINITY_DN3671_c0_g1~~TRINITY_DN3671_c0_g1_i10.p2  ORF type:complete len:116 (-),score=32.96 TRINITY_DN3671_c0_g1_i10:169-516(-)
MMVFDLYYILFVYFFFFFFNDTATTEIYTLHIVGSVRCVQETAVYTDRITGALMYNTIDASGQAGTPQPLVSKASGTTYYYPSIAKLKDDSYLICYCKVTSSGKANKKFDPCTLR